VTSAINVRWHTEGRRQPTLIGKDASGRRLPGGPYIVWQLLALPVAPLMWNTRFSWAGNLSGLAMLVVIAAATGATFYLIGRLNFAGRNPMIAAGALTAAVLLAMTAGAGKLGGSRVRRSRTPTRRRGRPAPVWHANTAGASSIAAEASNPSSVQPVAGVASAAGFSSSAAHVIYPPTPPGGPAAHPTPPVRQAAEQPTRMSPLEAFMAAAGKVNN
jgi:hypothetical protein